MSGRRKTDKWRVAILAVQVFLFVLNLVAATIFLAVASKQSGTMDRINQLLDDHQERRRVPWGGM